MTIEDVNKRRMSLLRISFPTDKTRRPQIEFELDPKEFGVVGYALVHWSFMEHALLQSTIALADAIGVEVPKNARQDSLKRRLVAFRDVIQQIAIDEIQAPLHNLAARIANANGFRQKLAHGIWSYDAADPEILHLEVSRYEGDGTREFLNVVKIVEFAERVSAISFELLYPGGLTMEELAEQRQNGPFFSRAYLRAIRL